MYHRFNKIGKFRDNCGHHHLLNDEENTPDTPVEFNSGKVDRYRLLVGVGAPCQNYWLLNQQNCVQVKSRSTLKSLEASLMSSCKPICANHNSKNSESSRYSSPSLRFESPILKIKIQCQVVSTPVANPKVGPQRSDGQPNFR